MKGSETITILVLSLIGTFFAGVVFQDIYGWFVADTFNITPITYAQALGLMLFLKFFKNVHRDKDNKTFDENLESVIFAYAYYLLMWGLGFAVSLFL